MMKRNKMSIIKIKKSMMILFSLMGLTIGQIHAANPGDPITAINFGEYATFGGSTWRKARYYDHTTFVSGEQGYFIRLYDNNYSAVYQPNSPYSNVFATSTLATSTLPTFYTNMTNTVKSPI